MTLGRQYTHEVLRPILLTTFSKHSVHTVPFPPQPISTSHLPIHSGMAGKAIPWQPGKTPLITNSEVALFMVMYMIKS
jgi:hypothetical protein